MSMVVRVFGQRLFHEHGSASIWSEAFSWAWLCKYLVNGSFMSMVVRVFGQRLFHEHGSASIWSEAFSWAW